MKRITSKSDYAETQSSMVNSMSHDLQSMMHPEEITQGDTQAWGGTFQRSAFEDSPTVTPTTTHVSTRKTKRFSTIVSNDTFPLTAETLRDISARKPYIKKAAKALADKAGGSNDTGQIVLCQCGFGKDEGDMVRAPLIGTSWLSYADFSLGTVRVLLNMAAPTLPWLYMLRGSSLARGARLLRVPARR